MPQPKIQHKEAYGMYLRGATDGEIAARFGVFKASAQKWRKRHGLPTKNLTALTDQKVRRARSMLREGASIAQVAAAIESGQRAIERLRRKMPSEGLRRAGQNGARIRSAIITNADLYPRILRAVGPGLPRDVKHDAANEMYVDVLDGRLSADLIEARASRYRNRAWSICGSNYGPVSLDAANDDDLSLGDLVDDPAALEAMDEAAERAWGQGKMLV